ncbi:MAG: hypothetical protein N3A38_08395, partial [Planctomycetota bacterium]|nr:hypothetical protein [Planctomycetota bacterium]
SEMCIRDRLAAFMQASFARRAALIVAVAASLIVAISTLTSSLENDSPSQASSAQPPAASSGDIRSADRPPEVRAPGTTGFDALGGRTGPRTKIENVPVKTGILSVGLKVEVLDGPLPTGESGRELEGGSTVTLPPPPQKAEAGTEASTPGR